MQALTVGDKVKDDSLIILDEDRLCYSVRLVSNGKASVRTISKVLLTEWVTVYRQTPNLPAQTVKSQLVGKSDIDSFEYGDAETLAKMAKMILGQISVVHAKADYADAFCKWFAENRGKGKVATAKKYITYFKTLTDSYKAPTHSFWHGLYRIMYGHDAEKVVIEIGELAEFDRIFGGVITTLETKVKSQGMTDEGFQRAVDWFWKPEVKSHTCVTSALKAYRDFLIWHETQNKTKEETLPANVDRLSIALKIFAEKRATEGTDRWKSYDEWTRRVRMEFSKVNESLIDDKEFNYKKFMLEFSVSDQPINISFSKHSPDEQKAVLQFLREQRDSPRAASWYMNEKNLPHVNGERVKGIRAPMALYFMSELHPEEFVAWAKPIWIGLCNVGLHNGSRPVEVTIENYEECRSKQQQIVARMKELDIGKASDDSSAPDYRTANEFLWWVSKDENKDLIKEKIMSKEFKKAEKTPKTGATRKLSEAVKDDDMMQRLMAALRTKPFAILAGHSGTGKSQLVRRLAYMTCNDEALLKEKDDSNAPGNYCMVQVKPNWHDSTDLLGYYTEMNGGKYHTTPFVEFICKAYAYPETPFFVCLDEMNLAPVEQYFAEFLSAIESYSETTKLTDRLITEKASPEEICGETKLTESLEEVKKHGLTIPRNLFVVGTVNVDETTCQFSRKVLDRAMTILMTAVSFKSMTEPNDPSKEECLDPDGIKFFRERPTQTALVQGQMDKLDAIQKQVGDSPFAIAYRFANEYALYQSAYQTLKGQGLKPDGKTPDPDNEDSQKTAIDHVVLMKLLPRIHGARPEMEVWFNGKDGDANKIGLVKTLGDGQSVDMMKSILARVGEYLSFWP